MALKNIIQRYTDIRFTERKAVGILFIQSLLLGFSTSFYFVAANTYFIKQANISAIPYAYIFAGVLGFILVRIFKVVQQKLGTIFSFIAALILFATACIALYIGHTVIKENNSLSLYLSYAGFILIFPFANLFVLGFSGICLQLFDISQSKRLLALIGTGEVIASIIGYLLVPLITKYIGGTVTLFLLASVFILFSIVPILKIYATDKVKLVAIKSSSKQKINWVIIFKESYFSWLAIVTFFAVLAIYVTDYTYLVSVRTLAAETGIAITDIIAVLFCIIKTGELLFSFLSAHIISSKGMKFSLLLLPFVLLVFSIFSLLSHYMFDDVLIFVVAFFMMSKWSDRVLRKGIYAPSTKVLYQVASPFQRLQLQTTIEGTISQLSIIISGIILLAVSIWNSNKTINHFFFTMSIVCIVFAAIWFALVFGLHNEYKKKIHTYLHTIKQIVTTNQQKNIATLYAQSLHKATTNFTETELKHLNSVLQNTIIITTHSSTKQLLEIILVYNPSLASLVNTDDEIIGKRMVRCYFTNDNFFSRVAIIWYLEKTKKLLQFGFINELYEESDINLRIALIAALNRLNYTPAATDRFYFTELCHSCIAEIAWAEPTLTDFANLQNDEIIGLIEAHIVTYKNHVLQILKVLYGNEMIHVVQQVLNEKDKGAESQIFAIELLDNILEPGLKDIIIPVFEPIPQQMKFAKLHQSFLVYHLPVIERLKEIIIRNFITTDIRLKQAALTAYYQLTKDEDVLQACSSSMLEELQSIVLHINNSKTVNIFLEKQQLLEKLQLPESLPNNLKVYLSRYAITYNHLNTTTKRNNDHALVSLAINSSKKLEVDMLGIAIILALQQQEEAA